MTEEYRSYRGAKAFALAIDEKTGRRTWGYGFGFNNPDSAIARALREFPERCRAPPPYSDLPSLRER